MSSRTCNLYSRVILIASSLFLTVRRSFTTRKPWEKRCRRKRTQHGRKSFTYGLELGKFPEHRSIQLSMALAERIRAQDAAGRLIFAGQTTAASPTQHVKQEQ